MLPSDYIIRPSRVTDYSVLADNMRQVDAEEVYASHGYTPWMACESLLPHMEYSRSALFQNQLLCIYGVSRFAILNDTGLIWMLGTKELPKHYFKFLRHSREEVFQCSQGLRFVGNWVDARNKVSIHWLRWLGFTIGPEKPYGKFGMPFRNFCMELSQCA